MLSGIGFTALIPINEVAETELYRLKQFSCGNHSLDSFLHAQAQELHADHLNHTNLLFHEEFGGLVGYITLSNDSIPLKVSEVGDLGLAYQTDLHSFPAVKIGRLAVHADLQRTGVGTRLLDLAIGEIVGAQTVTAARLMITDAVNDPKVIRFYERHGFLESFWATDQARNNGRGRDRATIKMIRDIYGA
jgi:ribosomal protein S18 acetylase RimI-like enzyme